MIPTFDEAALQFAFFFPAELGKATLERDLAGADGPAALFVDIIGLPFTPPSFAGVARRSAARAYWYSAVTAPYYRPYPYPPNYPPPDYPYPYPY